MTDEPAHLSFTLGAHRRHSAMFQETNYQDANSLSALANACFETNLDFSLFNEDDYCYVCQLALRLHQ